MNDPISFNLGDRVAWYPYPHIAALRHVYVIGSICQFTPEAFTPNGDGPHEAVLVRWQTLPRDGNRFLPSQWFTQPQYKELIKLCTPK